MKKVINIIMGMLLSLNAFSQDNLWYEKNIPAHQNYFETNFGITYSIPKSLKNIDKYYVMWKVRKAPSKHSGNMFGPVFLSKDKECVVLFPAQLFGSIKEKSSERKQPIFGLNPRVQITADIKTSLGLYYSYGNPLNDDTTKFDFYDYVTIVNGKEARKMFNADSIYFYDLPNANSVYFFDESLERMREEKYPYCTGLYLCKKNRATMGFLFFFSEKGEKNKHQYIELLNKHIWYDDKFYNN